MVIIKILGRQMGEQVLNGGAYDTYGKTISRETTCSVFANIKEHDVHKSSPIVVAIRREM